MQDQILLWASRAGGDAWIHAGLLVAVKREARWISNLCAHCNGRKREIFHARRHLSIIFFVGQAYDTG